MQITCNQNGVDKSAVIRVFSSGFAVYRDMEIESTHRNYGDALGSLSMRERERLETQTARDLEDAWYRTMMSDKFGPDWDATIFPDYGLDSNA